MGPELRVAVVQAPAVFLDREASTRRATEYIREARRRGVQLVVFPEGFIPGHPVWYHFHPATSSAALAMAAELFENAVEVPGPTVTTLATAARAEGVAVVIGVCERRSATSGTLQNSQLFIDRDGELVGKHQKLTPTNGERLVHAGGYGDTLKTFDMRSARVSGLICGENSNPLAAAVIAAGYSQIHAASWPNHGGPAEPHMGGTVLLASRWFAYATGAFVLNACATISEAMAERVAYTAQDRAFLADRRNGGGSCIIAPDASVIAGPMAGDEEGLRVADIDLRECVRTKTIHDYAGHYNRADVFTLVVNRYAPSLIEETSRKSTGGAPGDTTDQLGQSQSAAIDI